MTYGQGAPPPPPPPQYPYQPEKSGKGCFFYGCVTVIALFILTILVGVITLRVAYTRVRDNYTATAPIALPPAGAADAQEVGDRWDAFIKGQAKDGKAAEIALTPDEFNALIANHADWAPLAKKVHIGTDGDELVIATSFKLEKSPLFTGRYVNAKFRVRPSPVRPSLQDIVETEINNKKYGKQDVGMIVLMGLASMEFAQTPQLINTINRIQGATIKDGKFILTSGPSYNLPSQAEDGGADTSEKPVKKKVKKPAKSDDGEEPKDDKGAAEPKPESEAAKK